MRAFDFVRPKDIDAALQAAAASARARYIGGGTNLLDLMKEDVEQPATLIDINALPLRGIEHGDGGGVRIGALVSNADVAYDEGIAARYPLLSKAILAGASAQLRNMATTAGNLMQRTRCYYFYDTATACNKRKPGSGCAAREGYNRIHAIVGASEQCVAVHPSDMCVALAALDARVHVVGPAGSRVIEFADFHRLPQDRPEADNTLAANELVVAVELPEGSRFARHNAYLKIRDRASYAFALVSVAVALDMVGDTVRAARIALGGVAHKPWRMPQAEAGLAGQKLSESTVDAVASLLLKEAQPLAHNAFKLDLARRAIHRAIADASASTPAPAPSIGSSR